MEVTITGRHCTITDELREQISERLTDSISKLKDRVIRVEVEFTAHPAKGDPEDDIRREITLRGKGPVIRASAQAADKRTAMDRAEDKLMTQLRRAADRRKHNRGLREARSLATVPLDLGLLKKPEEEISNEPETKTVAGIEVTGDGPLVVREKVFDTQPLTLEQALDEMELVGHDFFLYVDEQTLQPSVVYRRKAYNYGVIHLNVDGSVTKANS